MLPKDDDFPYTSDDPELKQQPALVRAPKSDQDEQQEFRTLLRFLIGSAIEGSDEFRRRLRLWQVELDIVPPSEMVVESADESGTDRLRHALLGIFFQTLDAWSDNLNSLDKRSSRAYRRVSRLFEPLTTSRLLRPARDNYEYMVAKGESLLERWINRGRREERVSRRLVRLQAYDDMIDDVLDYMAKKPEVRDLVQQQSIGMAGEVLGEFRERSTYVDSYIENTANVILGRRRKESQPPPEA